MKSLLEYGGAILGLLAVWWFVGWFVNAGK